MALTSATVGSLDLDEFVAAIPRIYSEHDQKRSVWDVWMHANHHASAIGEEVRKDKAGRKLLQEIADFAMWLFTFLGKLQGELGVHKPGDLREEETLIRVSVSYSDLLWRKYPGMCPVCYWRRSEHGNRDREQEANFLRPCDCLQFDVESRDQEEKRKHVKALRAFSNDNADGKPSSVDAWQDMFGRIFKSNLRHLDLTDVAFHLLEEIGEVSDAMIRMYTYTTGTFTNGEPRWRQVWLEEEIADVSSWLFTLIEKLDFIPATTKEFEEWTLGAAIVPRPRLLLSNIIWARYGSDKIEGLYCRHCKRTPKCKCPITLPGHGQTIDAIRSAYSAAPETVT